MVAPFTGAWIEMALSSGRRRGSSSLPSRERGLKFHAVWTSSPPTAVAPFTGAWIEMVISCAPDTPEKVAPFTGAWIEIGCRRPGDG